MKRRVHIIKGDDAQLIFAQAEQVGTIDDGLQAALLRDGTRRLLVYSLDSGNLALIEWHAVATIAREAGVREP